MMRFILLLLLSFTSELSFGQDDQEQSEDSHAFDEILEAYYDEEYDSALMLSREFQTNYPFSDLIPKVIYNSGYILIETGREDESIPIFEELLNSNYDEKTSFGGIMEQYALFKHRSASHLADIYLDKGNYDKAKKYIRLFDKKYKYSHFGGNELRAYEIYAAKQYARLFHGQGQTDKAIKNLLPHMFYDGIANNESLVDLLDSLLIQRYTSQELGELFKQAKSTLMIESEDKAWIRLINTKIEVSDYSLFDLHNTKFKENMKLSNKEKWYKAVETHKLFKQYAE